MAIRDALTLKRAELQHDKAKDLSRIVTARQKTGTNVSVPIPPEVAGELLAAKIPNDGHMMSHRLRDTFAVDLLEKGVPLKEVSKLLGHESIKTTGRSYAKWVKGRQDRLDALSDGHVERAQLKTKNPRAFLTEFRRRRSLWQIRRTNGSPTTIRRDSSTDRSRPEGGAGQIPGIESRFHFVGN